MKAALVLAVGVLVSAAVGAGRHPIGRVRHRTRHRRSTKPGNGVTYPILLRQQQPVYTDGAQRARIEGVVVLEAVVQAEGTVDQVRVVRSLDTRSWSR